MSGTANSLKSSIEISVSAAGRTKVFLASIRRKVSVSNSSIKTLESQSEKKKRRRYPAVVEALFVSLAILILVGLSSLPVVFFYLPTSMVSDSSGERNTTTATRTCSSPVSYTGSVCRDELFSMTECFPDNSLTSDLLVVTDASTEQETLSIIRSLELFGSPECVAAATPFLCVHLFDGVCDSEGVLYLPTREECEELSTDVCRTEFELAHSIGMEFVDCEQLPTESPPLCTDSSQGFGNGAFVEPSADENDTELLDTSDLSASTCTLTCSEDFFCDERTLRCSPRCPEWTLFSEAMATALDYTIVTLAPFGILAGIGVLVMSCIRWKKVYVFPSVLVIYQTIDFLILILLHIITYLDRGHLYCTSPNLLESIIDTTDFCVVTGVFLHYLLLQINLWWVLHMAALFWKVYFPVHARSFQSTRRLKIIHALCIAAAMLLPLISAFAPIIGYTVAKSQVDQQPESGTLGFGFALFPPILCSGVDENITFYTVILPNVLLILVGTATLVLAIWKIHKEQGLFRSESKGSFHVSTAEKKLLIVFCYYIFLQVVAFVYFSQSEQAVDTLQTELFSYFICEQNGHNPDNPCSRSGFEGLIDPGITLLSFVLAMVAPAVNFVFVIDYREMKLKLKSLCN